jgi:hypothetical protein
MTFIPGCFFELMPYAGRAEAMKPFMLVCSLAAALAVGCGEKAETKKEEKEKPRLKGEGYGNDPISAPISTMWKVDRKVKIDLPIAQALQMHKITHDQGPQNQAEFEEMIKEQNVMLPKPQAGFRYQWNVKEQKVDIVPVE